jgi:hypothetical protein
VQTSRAALAATAVGCDSACRAPRSEAALLRLSVNDLYKIQMLVYFLYDAIWRSGCMVIGLLVLASVVAIAFDDDVAAAGLLAAAVLVCVGGF